MESGKALKVLFLTNIPSPYRVEFFEELGRYCDLTVLYEKQSADDREWKYVQKRNYKTVFMKGIKVGPDTALCFEVISYLKKMYDIIVIGGYSTPTGMIAIEYLSIKRIPFYLNCDGGFVEQERKWKYNLKKHFIEKATYWLSSGKQTNKYLQHYGAIQEKIYNYPFTSVREKEVLKQGLSQEEKKRLRKELGIECQKMVLSVGQFIHRKGFDLLIQASARFADGVETYIIGGTPIEEYLQILEKYQIKNVHFVEFCEPEVLQRYYCAADCMAFPTREDIWGLVINEALANGVPVVSTDRCIAALELVGEAGKIVSAGNVQSLYAEIKRIIENDELQYEMSQKACEIAREYTIENMATKHMEIFYINR